MKSVKVTKVNKNTKNVTITKNGKTVSANLHSDSGEINIVEVIGHDKWVEKYNGADEKEAGKVFNKILGNDNQ